MLTVCARSYSLLLCGAKSHLCYVVADPPQGLNPVKPGFIIVIFIHYKPRIAVAILNL